VPAQDDPRRVPVAQPHERLGQAGQVVRQPGRLLDARRRHRRGDRRRVVSPRHLVAVAPQVGLDVHDDPPAGGARPLEQQPGVLEQGAHGLGVAQVAQHRPALVAVDSPRRPAPSGTRSRPCERELASEVCGIRYTPDEGALHSHPSGYYDWILNGFALYDALGAAGVAAVECFPTASWTIWGGRRGRESRARWSARVLASMAVTGLPAHVTQDERDAIGAALTARDCAAGRTRRFGEIVVPA